MRFFGIIKLDLIFIFVLSTTSYGCLTDDYELAKTDGTHENPNGYISHYTLAEKIEELLLGSINKAVKSIWKKSRIDTASFMSDLPFADYTFLLFLEALANDDFLFSPILLNELNKIPSGSIPRNIFEDKVNFSNDDIYNSIKHISSLDNDSPISEFIVDSIKFLLDYYPIIESASLKNDLGLLKWLSKKGCKFVKDGPLAVEKAWKNNYINIAKYLIINNALVNVSDNNGIIFTLNAMGQTVLHLAVEIGHLNSVFSLIKGGANVNNRDLDGYFPLHKAIENNDSEMFELLVKNGADLRVLTKSYDTFLHKAAMHGNLKTIQYLIREGILLNNENIEGKTALYIAASGNFTNIMSELILAGANSSLINHLGDSLLHVAVAENDITCLGNLLKFGADVNAPNKENVPPIYGAVLGDNIQAIEILASQWGNIYFKTASEDTLLHLAASENKLKAIKKLINIGCDFKNVDIVNEYGATPLYSAAVKGNLEAIKLFKMFGANIHITIRGNWTLLHLAAMRDEELGLKSLLLSGFFVNKKAKWDYTALHLAVHYSKVSLINTLINYGANVNAKDHHNKTPIYEATWYDRLDVVKILCNKGAKIEVIDIEGATPLHVAAKMGHPDIIDFMLEKGLDIDCRRHDKKTPLYEASFWGRIDAVKLLLKKKANPNLGAADNERPLHKAAIFGHIEIIKMLIDAGADINTVDNNNNTPLDSALKHAKTDAVLLLKEYGALQHEKTLLLEIARKKPLITFII